MGSEERLVAEQVVPLHEQRSLTVRISQHEEGEFWRVDVTSPNTGRRHLTTTVGPGDSFMMHLISDAVGGEQRAWHHLARWGQAKLVRTT